MIMCGIEAQNTTSASGEPSVWFYSRDWGRLLTSRFCLECPDNRQSAFGERHHDAEDLIVGRESEWLVFVEYADYAEHNFGLELPQCQERSSQ